MEMERLDDEARLGALADYHVLDTPEEESLDDLTRLTAELLEVPICLVSLVDRDRQWFKSHHGIEVRETPRAVAFCDHAIRGRAPMVVNDALLDPRFRDNPLVVDDPNIRFYAGVPLLSPDGHALGTLCAIDRVPREIEPTKIDLLVRLAKQAEIQIELRRRLWLLDQSLDELRSRQHSREVLAGMVVHDLRSPLTTVILAVSSARELTEGLAKEVLDEAFTAAETIQRQLMDVLDICLAGSGSLTFRPAVTSLGSLVKCSLASLRRVAAKSDVSLEWIGELSDDEVELDPALTRRLLDNLLQNALKHSPAGSRITVRAVDLGDDRVRISVLDEGEGIPHVDHERVFDLFARGDRSLKGRGIGLTFCAEVVRLHGGTIRVVPSERGTNIAVELPRHSTRPAPS